MSYESLLNVSLDQAGKLGSAVYLLQEWFNIHNSPCRFDHHGYCQEHFLQTQEDCIVALTRTFLEKYFENRTR